MVHVNDGTKYETHRRTPHVLSPLPPWVGQVRETDIGYMHAQLQGAIRDKDMGPAVRAPTLLPWGFFVKIDLDILEVDMALVYAGFTWVLFPNVVRENFSPPLELDPALERFNNLHEVMQRIKCPTIE